jgi:hypothetical protein
VKQLNWRTILAISFVAGFLLLLGCAQQPSGKSYKIKAVPSGGGGGGGEVPNSPPEAYTNGPYSGTVMEQIFVSGLATDRDGSIIQLNWITNDTNCVVTDQNWSQTSWSSKWWRIDGHVLCVSSGTFKLTLEAIDNKGAKDTNTTSLTITEGIISGVGSGCKYLNYVRRKSRMWQYYDCEGYDLFVLYDGPEVCIITDDGSLNTCPW